MPSRKRKAEQTTIAAEEVKEEEVVADESAADEIATAESSSSSSSASASSSTEPAEDVKYQLFPTVIAPVPNFNKDMTMTDKFRVPASTLKSDDEFQRYFASLATWLLRRTVLVIAGVPHRFLEIEFYHNVNPQHVDVFAHGDDVQARPGLWYFHKRGKGYVGGSRKGLDISTGDEKGGQGRGGILIRGIQDIRGGDNFVGPCISVDRILSLCNAADIPVMVDSRLKGDISVGRSSPDKALYILEVDDAYDVEAINAKLGASPGGIKAFFTPKVASEKPKKKQKAAPKQPPAVYCSPRVGLHFTKASKGLDIQSRFVYKPYRFFVQPQIMTKKHLHVIWLYSQSKNKMTPDQIATHCCGQKHHIANYIKEYHAGFDTAKSGKLLQTLIGRVLSDKEVCQGFGALAGRE